MTPYYRFIGALSGKAEQGPALLDGPRPGQSCKGTWPPHPTPPHPDPRTQAPGPSYSAQPPPGALGSARALKFSVAQPHGIHIPAVWVSG